MNLSLDVLSASVRMGDVVKHAVDSDTWFAQWFSLEKGIFGREMGIGARSALGVGSLPENVPVEIEAIFEIVQY